MADTSLELLASIAGSVSTPSTKKRIRIFRNEIPDILNTCEMTTDLASVLIDIIFKTLYIYEDRGVRKAVDDVIEKALDGVTFMKSFAAALVQVMEKRIKVESSLGCYRLLKWSCILLSKSQFRAASKNALSRVAAAQGSLLHIVMGRSFRERRACNRTFLHLFSQTKDMYKIYMEELKDGRISYKDTPELISLLLKYSNAIPSSFEQFKPTFLDIYVKAVLEAREKPTMHLSEAFCPLFTYMSHEDFQSTVLPSSVKMLKRNPEIVLESVRVLLNSIKLDLSKYSIEILSVVLPQARHADEGRRVGALAAVRYLSQKSSNPDSLEEMFKVIKAVIGGSEGRLAFPYQRIGMVNALQELSNAPEGKHINRMSDSICTFLLLCYKDEGNEEVKLAILSTIASWAARSAYAVGPSLVAFVASGLKEKETLRRAHLRCLRTICKNADAVTKISSLLAPLIQLVKTGFTKAVQRLDAIYALLSVLKIAAVDVRAEETLSKEKIWYLMSQNEPSLVPISMASKLPIEDCTACIELLEMLLVEHIHRALETFSVRSLLQLTLFFICHPSWDVRRIAYGATRKIISAAPQLSEDLLLEFANFLSVVADKICFLKTSDTEISLDTQVAVVPSVEVLVKGLIVISSVAPLAASPSVCRLVLFCSHHPCVVGTACKVSVWRRLRKCLQTLGFDVISIISSNVGSICKGLLGPTSLMSVNTLEQKAAISSLCTLMSITPEDTYMEFEKYLNNLPDRSSHNTLSNNDIKIYHTPEGMLSNEQGVYVAESVAAKNTKQAKGRFRVYEDQDDMREPASREVFGAGKKDLGKSAKKKKVPTATLR